MSTSQTLYDQIKDIEIIGARLGGDPEIVCEIEDYFREHYPYPIICDEITAFLKAVPDPFPYNWKAPGPDELSLRQRGIFHTVSSINPFSQMFNFSSILFYYQVVITQAKALRDKYSSQIDK